MRSYFASFAFVTAVLAGYTVLVIKNQPLAKSEAPRASATTTTTTATATASASSEAEHRGPAAAPQTTQATTTNPNVD